MEILFAVLDALHPLSPELKNALRKVVVPASLPAHHFLLESPRVADHTYFLLSGFAMAYTYTRGQVKVDRFWNESSIILSPRSFIEQIPAQEFIRLTVPSELLCIRHQDVLHLFEKFPEANAIHRIVMNRYYDQCRDRVHDLIHLSVMERYQKLLQQFPKIEQQVSQRHIASYLGIAPQSLSRLKREHDRS